MRDFPVADFDELFHALTGHQPFPWQRAMFQQMVQANFDALRVCHIPTGLGKTSTIAIWLLALARRDPRGTRFPRRLVYIVNRRTVVDQATREVERYVEALKQPALLQVAERLRMLAAFPASVPLAVSTLRGELADNGEWRRDPARPAIVIGTVDMIGSRLLFSGYGRCGFKARPLHAAFVGQDSLIVHDEAHLEPAFQHLLDAIHIEQRSAEDLFPIHLLELTATTRAAGNAFRLSSADLEDERVILRMTARKALTLVPVDDKKKVVETIVQRALLRKDSNSAVLVFARTVEDVSRIADALRKAVPDRVAVLTGTQRGFEREKMFTDSEAEGEGADPHVKAVVKRFLPASQSHGPTVYLVCTSAGEVGIDMSGDQMICDLPTFDSLAQRLGRVNRFGLTDSTIDLVYEPVDITSDKLNPLQRARARTLALIPELPRRGGAFDASPFGLRTLPAEQCRDAFAPPPPILDATDILFDMWSMTSVRKKLAGRPAVADWLHGAPNEWTPPETVVAWRDEVDWLTPPTTVIEDTSELENLLDDYPLKSHEILHDRSERVFGHLQRIAERHLNHHAWLIDRDETLRILTLRELVETDKHGRPLIDLGDATVILGPSAGGLIDGHLKGDADSPAFDVADEWFDPQRRRRRCRVGSSADPKREGMRLVCKMEIATAATSDDDDDFPVRYWYVRSLSADDDGSQFSRQPQALDRHTELAGRFMQKLADALGLVDLEADLTEAARHHDDGKRRAIWQRSIGNADYPDRVLAKSDSKAGSLLRTRYRHELGSLTQLARATAQSATSADDLLTHTIGAHHGRCRPHFSDAEAFDPECQPTITEGVAREAPGRFARLQRRYGRWGLAYLESLLRAVDAMASQPEDSEPRPEVG